MANGIAPGTNSKGGGRRVQQGDSKEVKWLALILKALQNNGAIESTIATASGAGTGNIVRTGIRLLNNNGESFDAATITNCRSVSMTIITGGVTGVTIVTDNGTETINATGFTAKWYLDKPSDSNLGTLTITTADAIVAVNFTYIN